MPRGSSDFIALRPPRPSVTVTLRVICPAPQDIVPEKTMTGLIRDEGCALL